MEKKGILLVASINSFHGNVLPEGFARIYNEQLSLAQLAGSGLPMTINCHGMDFLMYPWLRQYCDSPNLDFAEGLFSHVMPTLFSREHLAWQHDQARKIIPADIDQIFYPEFCTPTRPENNFWVLDSQTHYYSMLCSQVRWRNERRLEDDAINYQGKIGLVMKEAAYQPLLSAFFLAQRLPDSKDASGVSNLDKLVNLIESVDQLVILPLDLEAPYVGSLLGGNFWSRLLSAIKERKLEDRFIAWSEAFPALADVAVKSKDAPVRNLSKWTALPATFNYYAKLSFFSRKELSRRENILLALAGNGDIAAAIYQKSVKTVERPATYADGNSGSIVISGSKEVIDASYLAANCLFSGERLFPKLQQVAGNKGLFWQRLTAVCEELGV